MKWEKLSLKDKADLMKLYIQNGFTNLSEIKNHYNSFDSINLFRDGGRKNSVTAPEYRNTYKQYGFLNYIGATDPKGNREGNAKRWDDLHRRIEYGITKGWTPEQIGAIIANDATESGLIEDNNQFGGDKAIGAFQMHGAELKDYNRKYNEDYDFRNQYDHIDSLIRFDNRGLPAGRKAKVVDGKTLYKYQTGENMRRVWNNKKSSSGDIAESFIGFFERPGKPKVELRRNRADSIANYVERNYKIIKK